MESWTYEVQMFYCISVFNGGKENSSRLFLGNSVIFRWLDKIIIGVIHAILWGNNLWMRIWEVFPNNNNQSHVQDYVECCDVYSIDFLSVKSKWPLFEVKSMFHTLLSLNCMYLILRKVLLPR